MSAHPPAAGLPIHESDLLAYVDGRLDAERNAEVEIWLVDHADDAHRIAADMAIQEGLRLLFGRPAIIPVRHRPTRCRWWRRAALAGALALVR